MYIECSVSDIACRSLLILIQRFNRGHVHEVTIDTISSDFKPEFVVPVIPFQSKFKKAKDIVIPYTSRKAPIAELRLISERLYREAENRVKRRRKDLSFSSKETDNACKSNTKGEKASLRIYQDTIAKKERKEKLDNSVYLSFKPEITATESFRKEIALQMDHEENFLMSDQLHRQRISHLHDRLFQSQLEPNGTHSKFSACTISS